MNLIEAYARNVVELSRYVGAGGSGPNRSVVAAVAHNPPRPSLGAPVRVDVVVNPSAGFFRKQRTLKAIVRELEARLRVLRSERCVVTDIHMHYTTGPGDARRIGAAIAATADRRGRARRLIIAAGGDGTANEIVSGVFRVLGVPDSRSNDFPFVVMRFPLGTGNDGLGPRSFAEAYDALLHFTMPPAQPVVKIRSADGRQWYALNIASLGLDAYIADLTNNFKRLVPGDSYRNLVDAGIALYHRVVPREPIALTMDRPRYRPLRASLIPSMVVFGASGRRCYGRGKPILPDAANVCLVEQTTLLRKLATKRLYYTGKHGTLPEVSFYEARRLQVESPVRMPLQADGEVHWLEPAAFPVTFEVIPEALPTLG